MPEVSARAAAQIIKSNHVTVRDHVLAGRLPARREGVRGMIRIEVKDLQEFANEYQYRFDEKLAAKLAK